MGTPKLSDDLAREAAALYDMYGTTEGARVAGLTRSAFEKRVSIAIERGFTARRGARPATPLPPVAPAEVQADPAVLRTALLRGAMTLDEIAAKLRVTRGQALDAVEALRAGGMNVAQFGDRWMIDKAPPSAASQGRVRELLSRPDGTFLIGFTSDNHLGSKYARLDVLSDLYDRFAEQGVDVVFNAGNWIDGEARFNKHDLLVHGMDAQVRYLVKNYPQRAGIQTWAVSGDDHEGWYAQNQGVDIGRHAERAMREARRDDWHDLGFMEAYVKLVNSDTGRSTMAHIIHAGGGTAYALSYTTQKIAEAYDGGDKPGVAFVGHYHKMSYHISRNVHMIQTGTTEDQTPFMRKRKIPAHVGGGIAQLRQDPATGALIGCRVEFFNYFNRGYANDRWNHADDVVHTDRGV